MQAQPAGVGVCATVTSGVAGVPPSARRRRRSTTLTTGEPAASTVRVSSTSAPSDCPSTVSVMPVPTTRRNGPAGRTSGTGVPEPAVATEVFSALPVVLTWTVKVPVSETCGTVNATVPLTVPASPSGPTTSAAVPLLIDRTPPRASDRWVTVTVTTVVSAADAVPSGAPSEPSEVARSTDRSPVSTWPRIVRVRPLPSKRRYGPAGRFTATIVPPTVTLVATAAVVVFTASDSAPDRLTPAGSVTATVPDSRPASPAAEDTSRPVPPVSRTPFAPAPKARSTADRPTVVTTAPAPSVARWTTTSAVRLAPWTVSVRCVPSTRR